VGRGPFADPVLEHRVGDPLEGLRLVASGDRFVVGPGQSQRTEGGGLGLDRQIGEDVLHQRLLDQRLAEC
jgi:hypothetical protein